jgi:hypothetical protein
MYTFHLRRLQGGPTGLEAHQLQNDGESFAKAGAILDEHLSCDHVDVWAGDRPVLSRHRLQPVIQPIGEVAA